MIYSKIINAKIVIGTLVIGLTFCDVSPIYSQDLGEGQEENNLQFALATRHQTISAEEARELSRQQYEGGPGQVVLLMGEGFSEAIIEIIVEHLVIEQNYAVKVYGGGERANHLQLFAAGGALPDYFDEDSVVNLPGILGIIVQQHDMDIYLHDK